jgi:polygalacturonase
MVVKGTSVTCARPALVPTSTSLTQPRAVNGNGHQLLGQGDQYWDGQGGSGGKTKPAPLLRINHSGTFKNVIVKNSPMRAVAVGGASIVVDSVTVDNCTWRGRGVGKDNDRR